MVEPATQSDETARSPAEGIANAAERYYRVVDLLEREAREAVPETLPFGT